MIRPVVWPIGCSGLVLMAVSVATGLCACGSERYTRPPGPAPRYEVAPLAPWSDTPGSADDAARDGALDRALAADAGLSP